jgi:hypothetical protein
MIIRKKRYLFLSVISISPALFLSAMQGDNNKQPISPHVHDVIQFLYGVYNVSAEIRECPYTLASLQEEQNNPGEASFTVEYEKGATPTIILSRGLHTFINDNSSFPQKDVLDADPRIDLGILKAIGYIKLLKMHEAKNKPFPPDTELSYYGEQFAIKYLDSGRLRCILPHTTDDKKLQGLIQKEFLERYKDCIGLWDSILDIPRSDIRALISKGYPALTEK